MFLGGNMKIIDVKSQETVYIVQLTQQEVKALQEGLTECPFCLYGADTIYKELFYDLQAAQQKPLEEFYQDGDIWNKGDK